MIGSCNLFTHILQLLQSRVGDAATHAERLYIQQQPHRELAVVPRKWWSNYAAEKNAQTVRTVDTSDETQ